MTQTWQQSRWISWCHIVNMNAAIKSACYWLGTIWAPSTTCFSFESKQQDSRLHMYRNSVQRTALSMEIKTGRREWVTRACTHTYFGRFLVAGESGNGTYMVFAWLTVYVQPCNIHGVSIHGVSIHWDAIIVSFWMNVAIELRSAHQCDAVFLLNTFWVFVALAENQIVSYPACLVL